MFALFGLLATVNSASAERFTAIDQLNTQSPELFGTAWLQSAADEVIPDDRGVCSTESIGDFNDDGFEDYAVGSCNSLGGRGQVRVIYGGSRFDSIRRVDTAAPLSSDVTQIVYRGSEAAHFGASVTGGYDINGDGIDDMAVGAPDANGGDGAAYVIYGRRTPDARINLGWTIPDGGSLGHHGGIYLPSSRGGDSEAESDDLGAVVNMFPNPRDPRRGALIVTDPGNDNTLNSCDGAAYNCGTAWVLTRPPFQSDGSGPWNSRSAQVPSLSLFAGDAQDDGMFPYGCRVDGSGSLADFGASADGGPDVTGDGVPDMVFGAPAPDDSTDDGHVFAISGQACVDRTRTVNASRCEDSDTNFADCGVIDTGRIDTHGYDYDGWAESGGNDIELTFPATSFGGEWTVDSDNFGSAVAILDAGSRRLRGGVPEDIVGDLNQDSIAEVVIGDSGADYALDVGGSAVTNPGNISRTDAGAVWTVPGRAPDGAVPSLERRTLERSVALDIGNDGHEQVGANIQAAGDIDRDGLVDYVTTSRGTERVTLPARDATAPAPPRARVAYGKALAGHSSPAPVTFTRQRMTDSFPRTIFLGTESYFDIRVNQSPVGGIGQVAVLDLDGDILDNELVISAPEHGFDGTTTFGAWFEIDNVANDLQTSRRPIKSMPDKSGSEKEADSK